MKRILFSLLFCFFVLSASAQTSTQVNTGDKSLSNFLTNMAVDYAAGKIAKEVLSDELKFCFGMSYKDFNLVMNKGYNAGEAYMIGLLHKRTGKSVDWIIRNRRPGQGWGQLAHQLGIHPSELNKMRVAMKKEWKAKEKAAKKGKGNTEKQVTKSKGKKNKNK